MEVKKYETIEMFGKDWIVRRFLYNTYIGRLLLYLIVNRATSKLIGFLLNSRVSSILINGFIKKHKIDTSEYQKEEYKTFNSFFKRKVKKDKRPFSDNKNDLIAPCDGKLVSYKITEQSIFKIKDSLFDISSLLKDERLATEYKNGTCLIFRLTPDDYHRYCYIDDGRILFTKKIKGFLHTVRPIALKRYKVYIQNTREYAVIETKNFQKVIQMEVGAMLVGRITNSHTSGKVRRGEEKGTFEFGGSTIIMLFKENTVKIEKTITQNTMEGKETIIKMGNTIGKKYK